MKKVKALLYCTKNTPYLVKDDFPYENEPVYFTHYKEPGSWGLPLNGKIVAMCDIETEEIDPYYHYEPPVDIGVGTLPEFEEEGYVRRRFEAYEGDEGLFTKTCLSYEQLDNYLKKKKGYALSISNLKIFKQPKELIDYKIDNTKKYGSFGWAFEEHEKYPSLQKAPQNMMRVYDPWEIDENGVGEAYVLISIRPEWICKILNGEKTIEVRKKVLKEML